jgi:HrpA-like RNA helicase
VALGALDEHGGLTDPLGMVWDGLWGADSRVRRITVMAAVAGLQMAEFPLPPMLSRMLLASGEMQCSEEITAIVAMLQVQHVFVQPTNKKAEAARRRYGRIAPAAWAGWAHVRPRCATRVQAPVYLRRRRPPHAPQRVLWLRAGQV